MPREQYHPENIVNMLEEDAGIAHVTRICILKYYG